MRLNRRDFVKSLVAGSAGLFVPSWAAGGASIIIAPPRYNSFGIAYDADVLDWVARVQGQGSDVSTGTKDAMNTCVTSIKTVSGLWDKLKRVGVFAGNGILALNAPLKNVWGSAVTDSINNFVSGDYAESGSSGGLTGGGSKFLNTKVNPVSVSASINDFHMSLYSRTTGNDAHSHFRAAVSGDAAKDLSLLVRYASDTSYFSCASESTYSSGADTSGAGFYVGSRTASNSQVLYRNGSVINTHTSPGGSHPNFEIFLYCANVSGVATDFSAKNFCWYSIGLGLTSGDVSSLYTPVQTLQTYFARQV